MRTLIFSLVFCVSALAQDTTAILEGKATDSSGAVLVGATVQAVNSRTGYARTQATTSAGTYHLALPVGDYDLRVSYKGFQDEQRKGIELSIGQTVRVDLTLEVY